MKKIIVNLSEQFAQKSFGEALGPIYAQSIQETSRYFLTPSQLFAPSQTQQKTAFRALA
ncbi:hypothetical protein [Stieleria bergensis]|uniref:hypothetical protein n=1 Tax=Stieleria bergensis TaxID=2528025 RepID=UPI003AF33E74